jgi:FkbM family methyltransferase
MSILSILKAALSRQVNRLGFNLIRVHQSPKNTLLGVASLDVGTVIDVGSNEGQFARMICNFFPRAELYCFEPLNDPFRKLSSWAQAHDGRVHCYQLALGDGEGMPEMHLHEQHTPSSSLLPATDACHRLYPQTKKERMTRVRVSTLDRTLGGALDSMAREILLKLDVQGFEDRVLRGGRHVLSRCRAVLLEVCLDPLYHGQAEFHRLVHLLHNAGFHYAGNLDQVYGQDGRVIYLNAVFLRHS